MEWHHNMAYYHIYHYIKAIQYHNLHTGSPLTELYLLAMFVCFLVLISHCPSAVVYLLVCLKCIKEFWWDTAPWLSSTNRFNFN